MLTVGKEKIFLFKGSMNLYSWWKEVLLVLLLLGSFLWNRLFVIETMIPVAVVYVPLEILWDLSAAMVLFHLFGKTFFKSLLAVFGKDFKNLQEDAFLNRTKARNWFFLNRLIALIQPILGAIVAYFSGLEIFSSLGLTLYTYFVLDFFQTIWFIYTFNSRIWSRCPRVEKATVGDVSRLMEIDSLAFSDPRQRASREEIIRRIKTSPGTCLVFRDSRREIQGVIYARPVNLREISSSAVIRWRDLAGDGNFSCPDTCDSLYVVGIAADPAYIGDVVGPLTAALGRLMVLLGFKTTLAGPDLSGFGRWMRRKYSLSKESKPSNELIEDNIEGYIRLERDGLPLDAALRRFMQASEVPFIGNLMTIDRGIVGYFYDPRSLGCAALVRADDPLRGIKFFRFLLNKSFLFRLIWGRLLEWFLLH